MKTFSARRLANLIKDPEQLFPRLASFFFTDPIEVVVFLCVFCLCWQPQWIAAELSDCTLNEIVGRLEKEWPNRTELSPAQLRGRLAPLWTALGAPAHRGLSSKNKSSHDKSAQPQSVGQTRLRDHLLATEEAIAQTADSLATRFCAMSVPWGTKAMPDAYYDIFHKEVFAFINRRVWNRPVAEELAAETWAKIIEDFSNYDPARGRFIGFALGKAKTELRSYFRRIKTVPFEVTNDPSQELLRKPAWPRHCELSSQTEILVEFLRQFVNLAAQVHKVITGIHGTTLEYQPLEIVRKFRGQTLGAMVNRAEKEFLMTYALPEDEVTECFAALRARLRWTVARAAKGIHLSKLPAGLGNTVAATTRLEDYFTGTRPTDEQKAAQIANWNGEVRRRLAL